MTIAEGTIPSVEEANAYLTEVMPASADRGMQVDSIEPDVAVVRYRYDPSRLRPGGYIPGPVLMELVDLGVWFAVFSRIGITPMAVTWELKINFLRPAVGGDVLATARLRKLGRRLAFADVELAIDDDPDRLVAHATVTYALPEG